MSEAKSLMGHATSANAPENAQRSWFTLEHDLAADLSALQQLAWALEKFSPVIGLEQDFSHTDNRKKQKNNPPFQPSSLLMDVTGLSHLFDGFQSLAQQVRMWCADMGYLVHVAIANTPGLAWGVAHFHPDCRHDLPWVIDGAVDNVAHPSETKQPHETEVANAALQILPVLALRLPPESTHTLKRLGIESLAQLQRIDRGDLRARFGDDLLKRIDQITGAIDEPIVACQQTPDFFAEESLEYATRHRETIEVVVQRLISTLCRTLKTTQQGGLQWLVRLIPQTNPGDCHSNLLPRPVELRINLFQPTADPQHVMPMVAMQLEQALLPHLTAADWQQESRSPARSNSKLKNKHRPPPSQKHYRYTKIEFKQIIVEVVSSVRQIARQRHLFDETPGLNQAALAGLINRLSVRLGAANVVSPTIRKGAQPEWSAQFKPLVDPNTAKQKSRRTSARRKLTSSGVGSFSHTMGRPLKLLKPPVAVKVTRAAAEMSPSPSPSPSPNLPITHTTSPINYPTEVAFRPPACIALGGKHVNQTTQPIAKSWGPERIETGWWRGMTVRRDYWRIVTEKGQQYWVYCDLRTQQWYLHGEF